jgi:hypothetical protein
MLRLTFINFYVFGAVVCFVTINVVYYLAGFERSTEDFFSDYSVLMPSVEFAIRLPLAFADSGFSVLFSITMFIFPTCGVALRI